jgi:hypothetical protein
MTRRIERLALYSVVWAMAVHGVVEVVKMVWGWLGL